MPEPNRPPPTPPSPSPEAVRASLDAILASSAFSNSDRLRRFLRFLVDRALAGQTDDLKEYTIGLEVFDRDTSYDPRVDSTVRVHAGKLRDRLREYYLGEGNTAAVRIDVPKGTYVPVFTTAPALPEETQNWRPVFWRWMLTGALAVAAFLGGAAWMHFRPQPAAVTFHQVSFRRGMISAARFSSDGNTVVYSAAFEGQPLEIFTTRPETPESRSLGMLGAHLLAAGPAGTIAAAVHSHYKGFFQFIGTLARASLNGEAARELADNVVAADWSPDGSRLAQVTELRALNRLESPPGNRLFDAPPNAWIGDVRFSPNGHSIAYLVHPLRGDNLGSLYVTDLSGNSRKLSGEWPGIQGVAWRPDGQEIWVAADEANVANSIFAVNLTGQKRLVWRGPDTLLLQDIARDGRVLLAVQNIRLHVMAKPPGAATERDLSWLDGGSSCGLSQDGQTLLIGESGIGGGPRLSVYLRRTDGSAAVRLGDGAPLALSPNGAWVLAYRHDSPQHPVFLPTGAGDVRQIPAGNIHFLEAGAWFPDSRRALLIGREPDHQPRTYIAKLDGGDPEPMAPEGFRGVVISLDGNAVLLRDRSGQWFQYWVDSGKLAPTGAMLNELEPIAWTTSPDVVYARSGDVPARIYRVNLKTGQRETWRELAPADRAGVLGTQHIHITASGDAYAYTYFQFDARLFVVDGLK